MCLKQYSLYLTFIHFAISFYVFCFISIPCSREHFLYFFNNGRMFCCSFALEHNTELPPKTIYNKHMINFHPFILSYLAWGRVAFSFKLFLFHFNSSNRKAKHHTYVFKCQIIAVLLRIMSNIESKFGNKDWKKNFYVNLCLVTVTTLDIFDNNNNISTQKLCLQIFTYTHSKTYPTPTVVPFNHPYLFRLQ